LIQEDHPELPYGIFE
jgi:hypothetical protein